MLGSYSLVFTVYLGISVANMFVMLFRNPMFVGRGFTHQQKCGYRVHSDTQLFIVGSGYCEAGEEDKKKEEVGKEDEKLGSSTSESTIGSISL